MDSALSIPSSSTSRVNSLHANIFGAVLKNSTFNERLLACTQKNEFKCLILSWKMQSTKAGCDLPS